jgi:hypothetical protein
MGEGLAIEFEEGSAEGELPAIIRRAQDEARLRRALAGLGYRQVRAQYVRQRQAGSAQFVGIEGELPPPMEFVRDWLRQERKRVLLRVRLTFLAVMATTIITGLAFVLVLAILD